MKIKVNKSNNDTQQKFTKINSRKINNSNLVNSTKK